MIWPATPLSVAGKSALTSNAKETRQANAHWLTPRKHLTTAVVDLDALAVNLVGRAGIVTHRRERSLDVGLGPLEGLAAVGRLERAAHMSPSHARVSLLWEDSAEQRTHLSSSTFSSTMSAKRASSRPRSVGGTFVPQVLLKALRALFTAASTSSTEAVSTVARCSPVAGL